MSQPRSIRTTLVAWLAAGLAMSLIVAGILTYHRARDEANALFDLQLRQTAASIIGMPIAGDAPFSGVPGDEGLVVQIWDRRGVRIYRSRPATGEGRAHARGTRVRDHRHAARALPHLQRAREWADHPGRPAAAGAKRACGEARVLDDSAARDHRADHRAFGLVRRPARARAARARRRCGRQALAEPARSAECPRLAERGRAAGRRIERPARAVSATRSTRSARSSPTQRTSCARR